jgi:hypothetical protein
MRLAPKCDVGHLVIGVLAAGLALLVALNYSVVDMIGRVAEVWSESTSNDRPASDQGAGSAPDADEESAAVRRAPPGLDKG